MPQRRRRADEQPDTVLVMPLDDAREMIARQVNLGQGIWGIEIRSREALQDGRAQRNTWWEYSYELLKRIVNTDQLAEEFRGLMIGTGGVDLEVDIRHFYTDMESDVRKLKSIV